MVLENVRFRFKQVDSRTKVRLGFRGRKKVVEVAIFKRFGKKFRKTKTIMKR